MKSTVALYSVMACTLAGLSPAISSAEPSSDTTRSEAPVVFKDSAITSAIKARFAADNVRIFTHIRVDTDDHGIVTLKGHTRTQDAADRAISIARDTDGVREVRSAIEIKIDD